MKKILMSVLLIALVLGVAVTQSVAGDMDEKLLKAVNKGNLSKFISALKDDADPNAIFGKEAEEWVMCAATAKGKETFLKAAVQNGGDINLRNTTPPLNNSVIQSIESAPVFCAVIRHNMEAMDFLLESNVKLDVLSCRDCKPFLGNKRLNALPSWHNDSPISAAAKLNEYEMVFKMISVREKLWDEELKKLILLLERGQIDLNSEKNAWRIKVAELLQARGHHVNLWNKKK